MTILTALAQLFGKKGPTPSTPATTAPQAHDPVGAEALLRLLAAALRSEGFEPTEEPDRLRLPSGIELRVEHLQTVELLHDNVRTSTRIVASHATSFPHGLPEFQHSVSKTVDNALFDGFVNWSRMDLITLEDCLRDKPDNCTFMEMDVPAAGGEQHIPRRVVFGPTGHFVSAKAETPEEHPFCPCCLFTQNFEAFRSLMQEGDTLGIRLFASRDDKGDVSADCRINGEDFTDGMEHLKAYARSWPKTPGVEFRKQYVVVRSLASTAPDVQLPAA